MTTDQPSVGGPTDEDRAQASAESLAKMWKFVENFARKSGSYVDPQGELSEFLVIGLTRNVD